MREREKIIAAGLFALLLVAWFAFFVHEDPRFAGSAAGGVLGVLGAAFMLVPYAYLVVKRIPPLRRAFTRVMSFRTFLELHIYAGIVGPLLALLHTGHKFDSPTGIALTTLMLVVVMSGFVGRYLYAAVANDIRDKKTLLAALEQQYHHLSLEYADVAATGGAGTTRSAVGRVLGALGLRTAAGLGGDVGLSARVVAVSESIADVEYALKTDEAVRKLFSNWLKLHIALSLALLAALSLHVFASLYYGVRWLQG